MKADTAVLLVLVTGMSDAEAIKRCDASATYFYAMKALRESGHTTLCDQVLRGLGSIRESAAQVANAAAAIVALKKCSASERELVRRATGFTDNVVTALLEMSPDQRAEVSKALTPDWIWNELISPALPISEVLAKAHSESASVSTVA